MPVDDVAVMRIVGRFQDQNIVNTLHYKIVDQTGAPETQWQELCVDWESQNLAVWLTNHVDTYTLVGLKVFTSDGQTRPPGFLSVDSPGTVVGISNDALVCRTITLYTADPNPRRRGRLMLSGGTTSMFDADTGRVTASTVTDLDALGASLLDVITGVNNNYQLVLWNKLLVLASEIIRAAGRVTPSVVRSRRAKQFTIG